MGAARPSIEEAHLSHFSPLDRLSPDLLAELRKHARIERFPPGKCLFSATASPDAEAVFLLSGQLALVTGEEGARTLRADSDEARQPVAHGATRPVTALARTSVTVLLVNAGVLDKLLRKNGNAVSDSHPKKARRQPDVPATNAIEISSTGLEPLMAAGAVLVDIRSPRAFTKRHLPGSINLPLRVLRHAAFVLDRSRTYILYGNRHRITPAALLLAQQGLQVMMLQEATKQGHLNSQNIQAEPFGNEPLRMKRPLWSATPRLDRKGRRPLAK